MKRGTGEWTSADSSAKHREALKRRARRQLLIVLALIVVTACALAALALCDPAVEVSVETREPPSAGKPVALFGAVAPLPITAKLGTLSLSWIPSEGTELSPVERELIMVEVPVSPRDCAQLSKIGGGCGAATDTSLHSLELVRVEALDGPLFADVTVGTASGFELEQSDEPTHRGAPVEWTLTENAATSRFELSCGRAVSFNLAAASSRRGPRLPAQTATCLPSGTRFRLPISDYAPTATATHFNRLSEFEAAATADQARIDVDHAKLVVDGDPDEIGDQNPVPVAFRPDGNRVSLRVRSPAANAPARVRLQSGETSQVLVDDHDVTPSELDRIPGVLIAAVLIPWGLLLTREAWRPLKTLVKERWSGNAEQS